MFHVPLHGTELCCYACCAIYHLTFRFYVMPGFSKSYSWTTALNSYVWCVQLCFKYTLTNMALINFTYMPSSTSPFTPTFASHAHRLPFAPFSLSSCLPCSHVFPVENVSKQIFLSEKLSFLSLRVEMQTFSCPAMHVFHVHVPHSVAQ